MLELAFFIAILWAGARAWDNGHRAVKRHTAARRKAVPDKHGRAAQRQAWTGWWVSEVLHGLPHYREGWAAGWHDHQDARGKAKVGTARRKAERAERGNGWAADIAEYLHRLEIAAAKREAGPSMSDQLRAWARRQRERLDPRQQDDQQPEQPPEQVPDESLQDLRNKLSPPPDDKQQPPPPDPEHNGGQPVTTPDSGSGGGGEPTFHGVNEQCEQAIQEAEQAGSVNVEACAQLADNLGAVIRDDSEMMGRAAEMSAAARDFDRARKRLLDAASAVKDHNDTHYAPHQDASDSTGVTPERAYTATG
jgi:hypothetical protein